MGTFKKSLVSPALLMALYEQGETLGMLACRARISQDKVKEILIASGVRLRTKEEVVELRRKPRLPPLRPGWRP